MTDAAAAARSIVAKFADLSRGLAAPWKIATIDASQHESRCKRSRLGDELSSFHYKPQRNIMTAVTARVGHIICSRQLAADHRSTWEVA